MRSLWRVSIAVIVTVALAPATVQASRSGSIDERFGKSGIMRSAPLGAFDDPWGATSSSDGSVLVYGRAYGGRARDSGSTFLARSSPKGSPVLGFGTRGRTLLPIDLSPASAAAFADGSVVVAGHRGGGYSSMGTPVLARLTPRGTIDKTFGTNGVVDLASQTDFVWVVRDVVALPDGKTLVALPRTNNEPRAIRFNRDGSIDRTFGVGGATPELVHPLKTFSYGAMYVSSDGSLTFAGSFEDPYDGTRGLFVTRLLSVGLPDVRFGAGGTVLTPARGAGEAVAARALGSGSIQTVGFFGDNMVTTRHLSDGAPDPGFSGDGVAIERRLRSNSVTIDRAGRVTVLSSPANWWWAGDKVGRHVDGRIDRSFGSRGLTALRRWLGGNMFITDTPAGPVIVGQPPSGDPGIVAIRLRP